MSPGRSSAAPLHCTYRGIRGMETLGNSSAVFLSPRAMPFGGDLRRPRPPWLNKEPCPDPMMVACDDDEY